jgi:hypothetical protein
LNACGRLDETLDARRSFMSLYIIDACNKLFTFLEFYVCTVVFQWLVDRIAW